VQTNICKNISLQIKVVVEIFLGTKSFRSNSTETFQEKISLKPTHKQYEFRYKAQQSPNNLTPWRDSNPRFYAPLAEAMATTPQH
jgi:hypothetical protein